MPALSELNKNRLLWYTNSGTKETAVVEEALIVPINAKVKINLVTFAVIYFPSNTAGGARPEKLIVMPTKEGSICQGV